MVLTRVGVWSVSRMLGILYGLMGLIIGAIFTLVSLLGAAFSMAAGEENAVFGLLFGAGAIVILPIFYGVLGLIVGALGGVFYNLAAKLVGGFELELEPRAGGVGGGQGALS